MIGALLAGGSGKRMGGGSKAGADLAGRPLMAYPAAALAAVCDRVAVVAKKSSKLPDLPGVERWDEPSRPRHPLVGIVHALEQAGGPVLVCAADMPFVTADACRSLMAGAGGGGGRPAAVAVAGGVLQPVFGVFAPSALDVLRAAPSGAPLTETVEALEPVRVALPPGIVRSVDTPEDLADAASEFADRVE